jgi:hypothetical protein
LRAIVIAVAHCGRGLFDPTPVATSASDNPWAEVDAADPARIRPPGGRFEVHAHAAALYVAFLRAGMLDEATEFAEWYLDTMDHDLQE